MEKNALSIIHEHLLMWVVNHVMGWSCKTVNSWNEEITTKELNTEMNIDLNAFETMKYYSNIGIVIKNCFIFLFPKI